MPLILLALLLFVLLAFAGVVLLSLALRYRAGTARRQGRRWVVVLNVWLTGFSAGFYLFFSFLISFWLGPTLRFTLVGMGTGGALALLGLALTRWESHPEGLFYTPSRWLALLITFAVSARLIYGWWRTTHRSIIAAPAEQHWLLAASGTQLSLAVGGGLIAYYLVFAIGVWLNLLRHERPPPAEL